MITKKHCSPISCMCISVSVLYREALTVLPPSPTLLPLVRLYVYLRIVLLRHSLREWLDLTREKQVLWEKDVIGAAHFKYKTREQFFGRWKEVKEVTYMSPTVLLNKSNLDHVYLQWLKSHKIDYKLNSKALHHYKGYLSLLIWNKWLDYLQSRREKRELFEVAIDHINTFLKKQSIERWFKYLVCKVALSFQGQHKYSLD